jgi:negative regulator of sigma-B (phosphoserine phosphatase)
MEALTAWLIEMGVAGRALDGQASSGDLYVVQPLPTGAFVAVVDGLGHGEEAAAVAARAVSALESHADESVIALVRRCHEALRGTRGAVMSLASFSARDNTMTWIGVGNVDGRLLRSRDRRREAKESLLLRGGVVGVQLPPLGAAVLPVAIGDTLILATDGIHREFDRDVNLGASPQKVADSILAEHRRPTDDALVLVCRYIGERLSLP